MRQVSSFLCMMMLVATAAAQVGKIGMQGAALQERLGPPLQVVPDDGGEMWFYGGEEPNTTFAYYLRDGVIAATEVLITHPTAEAARARVDAVVAAMEKAGWRAVQLNENNHLLYAGASVYRLYRLPDRPDHALLLSHMRRADVRELNGRMHEALFAVHAHKEDLSPELVASLSAPPAAGGTAPVRPTATAGPSTPTPKEGDRPPPSERTPKEPPSREAAAPPRPRRDAPTRPEATATTGATAQAARPTTSTFRPTGPFARRGYTWVLISTSDFEKAKYIAGWCRTQGWDSTILEGQAGGQTVYRVGLGWYPSLEALQAARDSLPEWAPDDAWGYRVDPRRVRF